MMCEVSAGSHFRSRKDCIQCEPGITKCFPYFIYYPGDSVTDIPFQFLSNLYAALVLLEVCSECSAQRKEILKVSQILAIGSLESTVTATISFAKSCSKVASTFSLVIVADVVHISHFFLNMILLTCCKVLAPPRKMKNQEYQ